MSGIDDLLAESHDRWAKAMKRAQGIEDIGLGQAVKIYYTRYLPAGLAVLTVAGTLVGVLAPGPAPSGWASHVAFGIAFASFGALIGGLVYSAKKVAPAVRFGSLDVLISLESGEQKHVRRQIAGKAVIDREHLPVIRAAAVQQRKGLATQLLLMPFYLFLFTFQAANLTEPGDPFWWIMVVGAAGAVLAILFVARDFRRTGRFLAHVGGELVARFHRALTGPETRHDGGGRRSLTTEAMIHAAGKLLDEGTPPRDVVSSNEFPQPTLHRWVSATGPAQAPTR